MSREDIVRMAHEAGAAEFYPRTQSVREQNYIVGQGFLERFAALVAAKEREACLAAALDEANKLIRPLENVHLDEWHVRRFQEQSNGAMKAYDAIRARGHDAR